MTERAIAPLTTLKRDRILQTGTGDRSRASSHEIELQAFDHNILLPTPSRGLSGSLEQNLKTLRASPLYEVSGMRSLP